MPRPLLAALLALALPTLAAAQETRFELGQRLRLLERALDKHPTLEARKRAMKPLEKATPTFFKGQLSAAAGLLDRARLLLATDTPADEAVWAASLVVRPNRRYLPTSAKEVSIRVEAFYKVKPPRPDAVQLRSSLVVAGGKTVAAVTTDIKDLPATISLPMKDIPEGDYILRGEVLVAGKAWAVEAQTLSLSTDLRDRLAKLRKAKADGSPGLDKSTLGRLVDLLTDLESGRTQETNYPAHRLLTEAEGVLAALKVGKAYYGPKRAGQFWLTLPNGDPVRVQIPEEAKRGQPLPVVVALHGAGGSENMFFDGYGDGLVAKLCAKRGWLLVSTRTPLLSFGGGPDVPGVLDELAKIYPVDTKKVCLVGHSMGAAQAVAAAGRKPERYRAVAALGGGGGFKSSEAVKAVRFFVGCGDRDFALGSAKALHRALEKGGVKKAVFKQYESVEHLIVVQLALPEVFQFFETALNSEN